MVGQITYTEDQILFVLRLTLDKVKRDVILREYKTRFNKTLTAAQLRYVKSKYGHDPEFGTALINGSLPANGGNRKTASSIPKEDRIVNLPVQAFAHLASNVPSNAYSLAPLASANHQHLNTHFPLPSTKPPRHPQLNTQIQPTPRPDIHSHSASNPSATFALAGEPAVGHQPEDETLAWDSSNPYGIQPVLQQYNLELRSQPTKRKLSDFEETLNEGMSPGEIAEPQQTDPKRPKLDSPMAVPKYEKAEDAAAFLPNDNPNAPQSPEMYQGCYEFRDQIEAEKSVQDDATPAMPMMPVELTSSTAVSTPTIPTTATTQATPYLQAPQMNIQTPYSYGLVNYGVEVTEMPFSAPALDALDPSLTFFATDTSASWSSYLNITDTGYFGSALNPSTHTFPTLAAFDPAVDPALVSYIDPVLLEAVNGEVDNMPESYNQRGVSIDLGIISTIEDLPGDWNSAEVFMGFDWEEMLSFDNNAASINDEFQLCPALE